MKKTLIMLMFAIILQAAPVNAQVDYLPVGFNERFICEVTANGNSLLKFAGDDYYYVDFERLINRRSRKLRRLNRLIKEAASIGNFNRLNKLKKRRNKAEYQLFDMEDCRDAFGYYSPDGGWDGDWGEDDGFGDPDDSNPGGGTPNPPAQLACDVVGGEGLSNRIINGRVCTVGNTSVVQIADGNQGYCTGTVVAPRVVITAGHCLEGESRANILTGNGSVPSQSLHIHPQYGQNILENNDIAVIITKSDLPTRIQPTLIIRNLVVGEQGVIGGYGLDENGNADVLRASTVNIDSFTTGGITIVYDGTGSNGNTCNGDSGGPLFVKRGNSWALAGVTSNGTNSDCGPVDNSNFANFTDPSNINWINSIVPGLLK